MSLLRSLSRPIESRPDPVPVARWLVVTLAVVSVGGLASTLVPVSYCAGIASNETAAIATLRNLASVQERFRAERHVDLDGDGRGEAGFLQEMTGAAGLRADATASRRAPPVEPALLSPALANVDGCGTVTKAGYHFRIWLPGAHGDVVAERGPGGARLGTAGCEGGPSARAADAGDGGPGGWALAGAVDADAAETWWCAMAWPVVVNGSMRRVFYVDSAGEVLQWANDDGRFQGLAAPGVAALPRRWRPGVEVRHGDVGVDGTTWKTTN